MIYINCAKKFNNKIALCKKTGVVIIKTQNNDNLLLLIRYMLKDGLSKKDIAAQLNLSNQKVSSLIKKLEDDPDGLSYSKMLEVYIVEDALLKKAIGGTVTEIKETEKAGGIETVKVTKNVPADTQALQFWLKNKYPNKWSDKAVANSNTEELLKSIFDEITKNAENSCSDGG